jgi:hypothetical protein
MPSVGRTKLSKANEKISLKETEPVNVANSRRTFRLFRSEIENSPENKGRSDLAVAIVTEACARDPVVAIGNRIIGIEERRKDRRADAYVYKDKKICGIVISWGAGSTYYMPFGNTPGTAFLSSNVFTTIIPSHMISDIYKRPISF